MATLIVFCSGQSVNLSEITMTIDSEGEYFFTIAFGDGGNRIKECYGSIDEDFRYNAPAYGKVTMAIVRALRQPEFAISTWHVPEWQHGCIPVRMREIVLTRTDRLPYKVCTYREDDMADLLMFLKRDIDEVRRHFTGGEDHEFAEYLKETRRIPPFFVVVNTRQQEDLPNDFASICKSACEVFDIVN